MLLSIEASDLPCGVCGPSHDFPGYTNIHGGVQRRNHRDDLLDLYHADAPSACWTLECTPTATPQGLDIKGPYVQGRPGTRFWRAKLMLDAIPPEILDTVVHADSSSDLSGL